MNPSRLAEPFEAGGVGFVEVHVLQVDVLPAQGINVYDILRRRKLVLTKAALEALEARLS